MMKFDLKRLYELLPVLYRIRDAEIGLNILQEESGSAAPPYSEEIFGPLKALLSVIANEAEALEENIDQLYDDLFIETCAEWTVDYIGQLIGYRSLKQIPGYISQRSEVANTIKYRRRKGTASVIEQLARDVTGWDANVVEYFQRLATTQYMNHLRPQNLSVSRISGNPRAKPGNKDWQLLEYANTPFDKMPKTADVRRIEKKRGLYNIPNIGVHLWRIKNYSITKAPAFKVDENRFLFNVLGKNTQLYNNPVTEQTITQLAERINVAMPISRRELHENLSTFYGINKSILIELNGDAILPKNAPLFSFPLSPPADVTLDSLICICDLSDKDDNSSDWVHMPSDKVAIDPKLGRIAFPPDLHSPPSNREVYVHYHYGFSDDLGGGEYNREASFDESTNPNVIVVEDGNTTMQNALNQLATTGGLVQVNDNELYIENLVINIAANTTIEIRAADGKRPTVKGNIDIHGGDGSSLILNGLLIAEGDIINDNNSLLQGLKIVHCTLVPNCNPPVRLRVDSSNTQVDISHSITGLLQIQEDSNIRIDSSIIDSNEWVNTAIEGSSMGAPCGKLNITNSTVIGKVFTRLMEMASDTIFWTPPPLPGEPPPVRAQRLQEGCVRFSYFPSGSSLPRPFRCQPLTSGEPQRVKPMFTSVAYGDAGYCQLSQFCAKEIAEGADDEAEMGVFHDLYQPQKVTNLRIRLDEYLRFGMEAGIFYAS